MSYRNIVISGDASLALKSKQMCVKTEKQNATIPVEDIDTVLLESRRSSISTALLSALAQNGTALFVCDEYHMPCGVLLPYLQHSRLLEVANAQLNLSEPAKKQLWKQIVMAKINNQAEVLQLCGKETPARELMAIAKNVKSGDAGNSEAHAAAKYFVALFGKGYTRSNLKDARNGWLNYGYAIVRGCVARTLAVYGFFQAFGLHHHSRLNSFNLADDFMEPFRPLVDLFVAQNWEHGMDITTDIKRRLFNLVSHNIEIDAKKYALTYAIERTVQSFSSVVLGKRKDLLLPYIVPLEQHEYE